MGQISNVWNYSGTRQMIEEGGKGEGKAGRQQAGNRQAGSRQAGSRQAERQVACLDPKTGPLDNCFRMAGGEKREDRHREWEGPLSN